MTTKKAKFGKHSHKRGQSHSSSDDDASHERTTHHLSYAVLVCPLDHFLLACFVPPVCLLLAWEAT